MAYSYVMAFCRRCGEERAEDFLVLAFSRVFPGINKKNEEKGGGQIRFKKIKGPGGSVTKRGRGERLGSTAAVSGPMCDFAEGGIRSTCSMTSPSPFSRAKRHCRCQFDEWAFGHSFVVRSKKRRSHP
ncbi:hypothetical protein JTE90_026813 [Oedothorax gibbosus]|uniref:Uncharacterized protein n=1 Tax=Oedothorax gibbosus TaxID=931172 RepID=A0AAV6V7T5_9ARAC|nr:hypothetical protein JTE90_026813 [Oedothorax gibbosus]